MSTADTPTVDLVSASDFAVVDIETIMRRDGYMKPAEAARQLGCGYRWLMDGLNRHGFPHARMGRAKWLNESHIREIRALCEVPADRAKIARLRRSTTSRSAKSAA